MVSADVMNAQELVRVCLAGRHRNKWTITGRTVYDYVIAPFMVWCDYFAPDEERDQVNPYMHMLTHRGKSKKEEFLKARGVSRLSFDSLETGFDLAMQEAFAGRELIANAPLFFLDENVAIVCDMLRRDDTQQSVFGDYHYNIVDVKNAKRMKHAYMVRGAFYTYVLGRIQQVMPKKFVLVNSEGVEFEYAFADFEQEVKRIITGIREIQDGKPVSPTAKSCRWPWAEYCKKRAVQSSDVSIVPMVGPVVKRALNAQGIVTVEQLASQDIALDMPEDRVAMMKKHAQAYVENKPQILSVPKLPKNRVEVFIDIEATDEFERGDEMFKIDFLIGVAVGGEQYRSFVARDLRAEDEVYRGFFDFLKGLGACVLYHYGPFERMHIRAAMTRLNVQCDVHFVDVLSLIRKHTAFPTISQSLKDIANYLGFEWRDETDAQETIVLYLRYLEEKDEQLLDRIMRYNEDDVRATKIVKEFLQEVANEVESGR